MGILFGQGGNFGKKIRVCRPTADPTKNFHGYADRSPIFADRRFLPTADFCRSPDFADKILRLCRPNSDRSENLPTPTRKCRFCRSEIATLV
jgi:hypothetical protein